MSGRDDDVPHYCGDPARGQARAVPPNALEISGLTVRHGDVLAVAVLGLLRPAAGTVRVLDRAPADAVRAGCVGAMLQHGGLPSEARVGEVVHLVRCSYPDPWPLDDLVATTGIGGLLGRAVDALSGGQRQRVLLALALAG